MIWEGRFVDKLNLQESILNSTYKQIYKETMPVSKGAAYLNKEVKSKKQ